MYFVTCRRVCGMCLVLKVTETIFYLVSTDDYYWISVYCFVFLILQNSHLYCTDKDLW